MSDEAIINDKGVLSSSQRLREAVGRVKMSIDPFRLGGTLSTSSRIRGDTIQRIYTTSINVHSLINPNGYRSHDTALMTPQYIFVHTNLRHIDIDIVYISFSYI